MGWQFGQSSAGMMVSHCSMWCQWVTQTLVVSEQVDWGLADLALLFAYVSVLVGALSWYASALLHVAFP